jgi:hypothetical protein
MCQRWSCAFTEYARSLVCFVHPRAFLSFSLVCRLARRPFLASVCVLATSLHPPAPAPANTNIQLNPLTEAKRIGANRPRREMEALFSCVVGATVAYMEEQQQQHASASSAGGDGGAAVAARGLRGSAVTFHTTADGKGGLLTRQQQRRRNLEVVRVTMLTMGALGAAAGRLWAGAVRGIVEPYLGVQVCACARMRGESVGGVVR